MIYFPPEKDFSECNVSDTNNKKIQIPGSKMLGGLAERALFTSGSGTGRLIVFYHGNQDSACNWRYIPRHFGYRGDDTLVLEYPGYAGNDRDISKKSLFAAVAKVDRWAQQQGYEEVYVVSYSLGGALASYHAFLGADRVLMFAPFDELIRVVWDKRLYYPRFMLYDDYNNVDLLQQSQIEVLIMHGADDVVIDQRRSARLADKIGENLIKRIVVPDKGHQNLLDGKEFNKIIGEFLEK